VFSSLLHSVDSYVDIMNTFKRIVNISVLSSNILSYTDAQFYDVEKQIIGKNTAELLKLQEIRNIQSRDVRSTDETVNKKIRGLGGERNFLWPDEGLSETINRCRCSVYLGRSI
jgi:hypothetical protein